MTFMFRRTTVVPAKSVDVWRRLTSPSGINDELMPVLRMTVPRKLKGRAIDEWPLGECIGRSWFLLLGCIPIDFDDITIAEREPGRRFLERSTMMSMSFWEHERTLTVRDEGTEVADKITFQLRPPLGWVPGAHRLMGSVLLWLFGHRHRRLARWFHAERQSEPIGGPEGRDAAPSSQLSD